MEERGVGLSNNEWYIMEYLWEDSPKTATQIEQLSEQDL